LLIIDAVYVNLSTDETILNLPATLSVENAAFVITTAFGAAGGANITDDKSNPGLNIVNRFPSPD